MLNWVIAVVSGYLIGSIPFALLLARRRGIDVRRAGSGNVGATNVLRTVGVRSAVVTLFLDAAKGVAAVVLARQLSDDAGVALVAALAAIAGHAYPVWLGFHGGKGVATAAGAFSVLAPVAFGIALMTFVITVWLTRFVSLGSMIGAVMLVCVLFLTDSRPIVTGGAAMAALVIIVGHRTNLARLIAGTEHRLDRRQITSIGP
jgi:acyl phosphate:glycerol-3-phosphate acyltransferase